MALRRLRGELDDFEALLESDDLPALTRPPAKMRRPPSKVLAERQHP